MLNVFDLPQTRIPIAGSSEQFPVRRIYCVGQNYAAHAREMGGNPDREPPFYFMKPADAAVPAGSTIAWPPRTSNLHHEIELVVAIGTTGANIALDRATAHVFGYAVGIDLTRRDLQAAAKKAGRPWDTAKGFDQSAPISRIHRSRDIGHPSSGRIWLAVNGELRQDSDLGQMIWDVSEAIAELSTYFTLQPGDLVFTGTPDGVGPLQRGDRIAGGVQGVDEIHVSVAS